MDPLITPAPAMPMRLLGKRLGSTTTHNIVNGTDTCGYLSGDIASPLTCPVGYTCTRSTYPDILACCNSVNCAPSSGAGVCITEEEGSVSCTGTSSEYCLEFTSSLLFCTQAPATACITYLQQTGSDYAPKYSSYSCGASPTTKIFLAQATNAPAKTTSTSTPSASSNNSTLTSRSGVPVWGYVVAGIGSFIVLMVLICVANSLRRKIRHRNARKQMVNNVNWQREQQLAHMPIPPPMPQTPQMVHPQVAYPASTLSLLNQQNRPNGPLGSEWDASETRSVVTANPQFPPAGPPGSVFGASVSGTTVGNWLRDQHHRQRENQ